MPGWATPLVDGVTDEREGLVVEFRFPATLRAPFLARRLVGSLIVSGPRLRALDAALLAGELTTAMLPAGAPVTLGVTENGRTVRVAVGVDEGAAGAPDSIVTTLLDRVANRWAVDEAGMWFEIDLIRKQALTDLPDEDLFALLPDDRDARDELFERYVPFASSLSRRYRSRRGRADDLEQVALMGLVEALDRFDTGVGVKFTTFAGKTISGVLKRHLRDNSWSMRVPRSLKNDALDVTRTRNELTQQLGREPAFDELAEALDMSRVELRDALLAGDTYSLPSLDAPAGDDQSDSIGSLVGDEDPDLVMAEQWPDIEAVLDRLTDREQQILYLRFFEDLTQSEIAPIVGVSQVHVSRLLKRSLEKVRNLLEGGDEAQSS